jgi:large subunit ribosomal protein L5
MEPILLTEYKQHVVPALREKLGCTNIHQVPRLEKIVVNACIGKDPDRKQAIEDAAAEIAKITGQRPVVTKAKKSVANFKLREGEPIGAYTTLRGHRMYDFLLRFMRMAIPRIRDFRGVPSRSFDGRGNYTIGVADQTIFPEIELEKIKRNIGFDVTIVTTARTDEAGRALLRELGMPFRDGRKQEEAAA